MDEIQKVLIKVGRKDLAQKYYEKIAKEVSLSELKNAIEFSPKFKAQNFFIKDNKVFKRGPHDMFVEIRKRDMIPELGLRSEKEIVDLIENSKDIQSLVEELKKTNKFHFKKVAGDESEEGRWMLWRIISTMHSTGIYHILSNLHSNDLLKIKKYDSEVADRISKIQTYVKKEIEPLVVDLNTWFKDNDKDMK